MTKAIASYPKSEQKRIVALRLEHNTGGLGYLAAQEAEYHIRCEEIRKQVVKNEAEKP